MNKKYIKQGTNVALRLGSLGAKLALSLYMGRYLTLPEMGNYGLVLGAVMFMAVVLGMQFNYVVSRDIVGTDPTPALCKMRDQAVLYMMNHIVFAVVMVFLALTDATGIGDKLLFFIFALSVVESFAGIANSNMISLGHPVLANLLYFISSASWIIVAIGLGLFVPSLRNDNTIMTCWLVGVLVSYGVTFYVWRNLPWRKMLRTSVDWGWIKKGVKKSFFIWVGSIGISLGIYVDRFVVMSNMGIHYVGIATFYFSFANTLKTLVQSGVLAFAYPRLIILHRNGDKKGFKKEARQTGMQVAVFSGLLSLAIGICVPLMGGFFNKPELVENAPTLWLMLLGVWIQANALTLYYILFARHQDKAVWLGNLLFIIPAFGFNILLVPLFGLIGIGYGSVISSLCLFLWRWWHVSHPPKKYHESKPLSESNLPEMAENLD